MIPFHRTIQAIILTVLCMFNGKINSFSQDSIKSRVICIGDAGEIDGQQQSVLSGAARMIIPGKTTVTYLGDNIYPSGFGLTEKSAASSKEILRKQFEPMRVMRKICQYSEILKMKEIKPARSLIGRRNK